MIIKQALYIEAEDLTRGINFTGAKIYDERSCERIKDLSMMLSDIIWNLEKVRNDTLEKAEYEMAKAMREEIDRLLINTKEYIYEVEKQNENQN
ncbi:hypothetical protein [Staphylococcus casei]|uniref:Uncharacterized protein n=1 Tax=Staphylococcus casei TaxID=201828 RepID=A0ABZ2WCT2_9STAP